MNEGSVKPPQSLWDKVRAFYDIFGWKMPAVMMGGLMFSVAVVAIPFIGRRSIGWLQETALATFAGFLTIVGFFSLRARWLSLGPLEGFQVRRPRPWHFLRWLGHAGLMVLGSVLLIGWFVEPLPDQRMRWLVPLEGACCLIVALSLALMSLRRPLHILVREGLALRHRQGWSLIPWERIGHVAVGTYYDNIIATVELDHLLTPLPTAWRPGLSEEQRQQQLDKQLKGFELAERWTRTDVMVWGWSCKMPPGLFALRATECLTDPAARQTLPTFEGVSGTPLGIASPPRGLGDE